MPDFYWGHTHAFYNITKWLEGKYTLVFLDYLFHGKELWVLHK